MASRALAWIADTAAREFLFRIALPAGRPQQYR